jgi:hypothetical protein
MKVQAPGADIAVGIWRGFQGRSVIRPGRH